MVYLVVFLGIALVVGPIFWLRPSPREKHLSALRQTAISNGLTVQVPLKDEKAWIRQCPEIDTYRLVRYLVPLVGDKIKEQVLTPALGLYHHYEPSGWRPIDGGSGVLNEEILAVLAGVADAQWVNALEIKRGSVAIYWQENEGPEEVKVLAETLAALRTHFVK